MRVHAMLIPLLLLGSRIAAVERIDRRALVSRHNPVNESMDLWSPLTVGNGEFAFTADATGLQTFPELYEETIPLSTLAQWGWHTTPDTIVHRLDAAYQTMDTYGREVQYAARVNNPAAQWLRANPHRLHLGRIGFDLRHRDGSTAVVKDLDAIHQSLDLWSGTLTSEFQFDGETVQVTVACDPAQDRIAVQVHSRLVADRRLRILLHFPYAAATFGPACADFQQPDRHETRVLEQTYERLRLQRRLDTTWYYVGIDCDAPAQFISTEKHRLFIQAAGRHRLGFVCAFSPDPISGVKESAKIFHRSRKKWNAFWSRGAAVDFSACRDSLAFELERRVVLSQYLTRIQCAGSLPPAETGLTCNSWYGKFHLEMHWWHAVHFALWGRPELLEKSMAWYQSLLPAARAEATRQGYCGARWPKMVGPDGRESPSTVGVFLIWQQPHPIYYAELLYRLHPKKELLKKYQDLVFATADFLASFAVEDSASGRYVLGPPMIPAQEKHRPESTRNPPFELTYWRFALQTALQWRQRLNLAAEPAWEKVLAGLAAPPVKEGLYLNAEGDDDTFANPSRRRDHPTLLAGWGMLPGPGVDSETMRRTLHAVMRDWDWQSTWGWDFPLVAMTAARLGEPELAIQALMMPAEKNRYLKNGHNYQRANLPVYLPGNGGLLAAVAMMAAGWEGGPSDHAPGFPKNSQWNVRWEGLNRLP